MRFGQAAIGDRIVFDNFGGVWKKVDTQQAELVFGQRGQVGRLVSAVASDFVYVINEQPNNTSQSRSREIVVRFVRDDEVLQELRLPEMVAALATRCEEVMVNGLVYEVEAVGMDLDSGAMRVEVSQIGELDEGAERG